MIYRDANITDKDIIVKANKEICELSGLNYGSFHERIDKDLFQDKACKCIVVELDGKAVGFIIYSYIYWADCGKGIYLSQAYVEKEYRGKGIYKALLKELELRESECYFITDLVGKDNDVMKKTMRSLCFEESNLITYYKKINRG